MSSAFWWPVTHTPVLTGKGKLVVLLSCCFHVEGVGDTVGGGIRWVGRYCREILETSKPKLYFCQLRSLVFFSVFKRVRKRNHFFSKLHKILYQNFHNFQRYRTIINLVSGLRSASLSLLHVPRSNQKSCGDRAFAVAAPRLWNALPIQMRQPGTALDTFKRSLKTLLFRQAFYRFL